MKNKLLSFLQSRGTKKGRKRKAVNRQQLTKRIAKSKTPLGGIAKQKLKKDRMLKEIMRGM